MILISSAAYIASELKSEFGELPPAFLPVGNKRIFEHQTNLLKNIFPNEQIFISIPQSFLLSSCDKYLFEKLGVKFVSVLDDLSLCDSILYSINSIGNYTDCIRILHGDTLIYDLPTDLNCIAVGESQGEYQWYIDESIKGSYKAWAGYFSFDSINVLAKALIFARGNFEKAVIKYDVKKPLSRIAVNDWLDFDHINNFYKSRSKITTQRSFNSLIIKNNRVYKSGVPALKIKAESYWFENLPYQLKTYIPQFLNSGVSKKGSFFYEIEYIYCAPLNEMYVYGKHNCFFWEKIFLHVKSWFDSSSNVFSEIFTSDESSKISKDFYELVNKKTKDRLRVYADKNNIDLEKKFILNGSELPSLNCILNECLSRIKLLKDCPGILHGDLCFSNILLDTRSDSIKLLDPRGLNSKNEISITGDLKYDLAKLMHSVVGMYDYIIADTYTLSKINQFNYDFYIHSDPVIDEVQNAFVNFQFLDNVSTKDILPICVLLFLSMLPLHSDRPDRQDAMLANALRLYLMMENI